MLKCIYLIFAGSCWTVSTSVTEF